MKTFAVALLVFSGVARAQDLSPFASDVALTWNTHPQVACPEFTAIAVTAVDGGDGTATLADGSTAALRFAGYSVQNMSDVGQILSNSYSLVGTKTHMSLEFNDDGSWPATRLEGFRVLKVYTGVQGRSGVYTSQICAYKFL